MNAIEALNAPVKIILGGQKYTARRISALCVMACAEKYVIAKRKEKIERVAEMLEGKAKENYIIAEGNKLPQGLELEALARPLIGKKMPNEVGADILYEALKEDNPEITQDNALQLLDASSAAELVEMLRFTLGKVDAPDGDKSGGSRKPTGGRRKSSRK